MTQENKPKEDNITDWSEVYATGHDITVDLTPSEDVIKENTRKNNVEPIISKESIDKWAEVYSIEGCTQPNVNEVEYEGNQILPARIKSIIYFTDLDTEDNILNMNLKEVPEIQHSNNKLENKISKLRNNSIDESNTPKPR